VPYRRAVPGAGGERFGGERVAFPIFGGEGALERARKQRQEARFERAIRILEKELKRGEQFDLLVELGCAYFDNGQTKEAASVFKRAAAADAAQLEALLGVVEELHYRANRPPETGEFLLETYVGRRDFENARRTIHSLDPHDVESLQARYEKIFENIGKYKSPDEMGAKDIVVHYCISLLAVESKDVERGLDLLRKVVEISANEVQPVIVEGHEISRALYGDPRPCLFLGELYAYTKQMPHAVREFKKAVEFDRDVLGQATAALEAIGSHTSEAVRALLDFYLMGGRLQDATRLVAASLESGAFGADDGVRAYREIVRLDATQVKAYLALGDAYLGKGQIDAALSEYSRVLEADPGSKGEVIGRFRAVFERDPTNHLALGVLADALLAQGEYAEASRCLRMGYEADRGAAQEIVPRLQHLLEARTDDVAALDLLGEIFTDKGQTGHAVAVYEHQSYCGEEGLQRARAGLERLYEKAGGESEVELAYAGVLRRTGEWQSALSLLADAAGAAPGRVTSVLPHVDLIARGVKESLPEVIALYRRLRELGAEEFLVTLALGEACGMAGQYREMADELGRCYRMDPEQLQEVIDAYDRVLAGSQEAGDVRMGFAELLLEAGNLTEAVEHYERVLAADPRRFDQIITRYKSILEADQKNSAVRRALIDAYRDRGLFDQVIQEAKRAIEAVPREESAYFQLRLGEGMAERGALTQSAGPILGAAQLDESLSEEGVRILGGVLSIDKQNVAARYVLGKVYGIRREVSLAVEQFMTIAKIAPDRAERVVGELTELIEVDPANADSYYARGTVQSALGHGEEAVADLERAVEIDPAYVDRVMARINKMIQSAGQQPRLLLALARAQIRKGYDVQAIPTLSKVAAADPGLHETVVRELHRIMERSPENVGARFALADCYVARKNLTQAVEILEQAGDIDPSCHEREIAGLAQILRAQESNIPCHFALARTYARSGDYPKAVEHYRRILDLDPDGLVPVLGGLEEMANRSGSEPVVLDALTETLISKGDLEAATARLIELAERDESMVETVIGRLREIVRLDAAQIEASRALGDLHLARGEIEEARDALAPVLKSAKDLYQRARIRIALSHALYRLGKREEAEKEAKLAMEEAPDGSTVCREFEQLHARSARLDLERNRRRLEEEPENEGLRIETARQLRSAGQLDEAERLLAFHSRTGRIERMRVVEMARCLVDRHNMYGAAELLMAADPGQGVGEEPDDETVLAILDEIAAVHERAGDQLGAAAALRRLVERGVPYRDATQRLERSYAQLVADQLEGRPRVLNGVIGGGLRVGTDAT
jgi:tetratricopeptide (TPR) repeat protein